ncbi:MAG: tetratricopeptide repeat protein, partial [Bacteroidia bacterium]|nr:tetratricopeptide repeat protein [Bacteroidia bacterium]
FFYGFGTMELGGAMKARGVLASVIFLFLLFPTLTFSQSEGEGKKLYDEGIRAYDQRKYQDAIGYFKKALDIANRINDIQDISVSLRRIGEMYEALGQHEEAVKYYEDALKYYEEVLKTYKVNNQTPELIGVTLASIGTIYRSLHQYEKALSYF